MPILRWNKQTLPLGGCLGTTHLLSGPRLDCGEFRDLSPGHLLLGVAKGNMLVARSLVAVIFVGVELRLLDPAWCAAGSYATYFNRDESKAKLSAWVWNLAISFPLDRDFAQRKTVQTSSWIASGIKYFWPLLERWSTQWASFDFSAGIPTRCTSPAASRRELVQISNHVQLLRTHKFAGQ